MVYDELLFSVRSATVVPLVPMPRCSLPACDHLPATCASPTAEDVECSTVPAVVRVEQHSFRPSYPARLTRSYLPHLLPSVRSSVLFTPLNHLNYPPPPFEHTYDLHNRLITARPCDFPHQPPTPVHHAPHLPLHFSCDLPVCSLHFDTHRCHPHSVDAERPETSGTVCPDANTPLRARVWSAAAVVCNGNGKP